MTRRRATVHAMAGLPAAGKTTVARQMAEELPAVHLSLDAWMLSLYDLAHDDAAYVEKLPRCRALLLETASAVVSAGVDVILDWNHWSPERRADSAAWAAERGAAFRVHHVATPLATCRAQAQVRSDSGDPRSHRITPDQLEHALTYFVEPDPGEGHELVVHGRDA